MSAQPEPSVTASLVERQLGSAYERFDAEERSLHLELLNRIERPEDVAVTVQPAEAGPTKLTICTADAVGALSLIAGLCTAYELNIVDADVFTVRAATETPSTRAMFGRQRRRLAAPLTPRRRILDVFEVRTSGTVVDGFWERFEADLRKLVAMLAANQAEAARDEVIDRVSDALRAAHSAEEPLFPIDIEVDNDASLTATVVRIRSTDTVGFLFEFTNALALLNVNIDRAEIRTVDGETRDTFWVTDTRGQKLTDPGRLHELRVAAALIKQFTLLLPRSPNPAQALRQFSALTRQLLVHPDWTADLHDLESGTVLWTLAELMGVSEFLWEDFLRMQHENLFPVLSDTPALAAHRSVDELRAMVDARLALATDEEARRSVLNEFKDREMFRIDLRHITGRIDFREFADELSDLAEVVVQTATSLVEASLAPRYGHPRRSDGARCGWAACALGKFGGRELGFASDIELLMVYEDEGTTDGHESLPNARYFEEFVRALLNTIRTQRLGIFEIDLRLRPYGDAGPLASTEAGFRGYYSPDGDAQQFERMALVKLRPVAGDVALGARVEAARDAFVYSDAPLDVADLRHLRHRQATELVPPGEVSAKYSEGGVVDVEYFVQMCQIRAGASDQAVRVTSTLDAIERLLAGGRIDSSLAASLAESYSFLRNLIDGLRVVRGNAKDLTIPRSHSREFAYLARRMRYESPAMLRDAIDAHMSIARGLWDRVPATA